MYDEETLQRVIREAVHETLSGLGFNIQNRYEVQADMQYLHKLRRNSEDLASRMRLSVISVSVPAALYLLWAALKKAVSGG